MRYSVSLPFACIAQSFQFLLADRVNDNKGNSVAYSFLYYDYLSD